MFVSHNKFIFLKSNILTSPLSYPEHNILSSSLNELPIIYYITYPFHIIALINNNNINFKIFFKH